MDWGHLFFKFNGRINRGKYWLAWLVFGVIYLIFYLAVYVTESRAVEAVSSMVIIVIFISGLAVGVKRLHDRNKSGWYLVLFYIVPGILGVCGILVSVTMEEPATISAILGFLAFAIGVWAFVELGCLRGTIGANRYGPDPVAPATVPPIRTPV